jgi:IS1 family transposase/transposase-like protein
MTIKITLKRPKCLGEGISENGKKFKSKQNYICKTCGGQFMADHERVCKGSLPCMINLIKRMLVRGSGIRDIGFILEASIYKVLKALESGNYVIKPKKLHYDCLEMDELWTFVGSKSNKKWFIYAYDRASGEIVAYVWGNRGLRTAKALKNRLKSLGVGYGCIASDEWSAFLGAFKGSIMPLGKAYATGIEGNNCRLRHRIRRIFRKTCCFSKKFENHKKAFGMAVFYINYGFM